MARILVIGGTRFFGLEVLRGLVARGDDVTVLSRRAPPEGLGVRAIIADRTDAAALARAMEPAPEAVFDNVAMTGAHVEQTLAAGVRRYVLTTTGSIYTIEPGPIAEEADRLDEPDPTGDDFGPRYARGKREAERALLAARGVHGTIVRPTIVYGAGDPTNRLTFYEDAVRSGTPLPSSRFRFNPVWSRDLAAFILGVLADPPPPGRAYNVAGADVITPDDLCAALARVLQRPWPPPGAPRESPEPPLPPEGEMIFAIDRARRERGYAPAPLDDWLRAR
jgi:nucleoside-diphosphate-sugar epimerase